MEGEGQTGGGGGGSGGAVDSDAWVWWQRQAAAVTPTDHLTRLPVTWPYPRPVRFFRPSLGMSLPLRPPSPIRQYWYAQVDNTMECIAKKHSDASYALLDNCLMFS